MIALLAGLICLGTGMNNQLTPKPQTRTMGQTTPGIMNLQLQQAMCSNHASVQQAVTVQQFGVGAKYPRVIPHVPPVAYDALHNPMPYISSFIPFTCVLNLSTT